MSCSCCSSFTSLPNTWTSIALGNPTSTRPPPWLSSQPERVPRIPRPRVPAQSNRRSSSIIGFDRSRLAQTSNRLETLAPCYLLTGQPSRCSSAIGQTAARPPLEYRLFQKQNQEAEVRLCPVKDNRTVSASSPHPFNPHAPTIVGNIFSHSLHRPEHRCRSRLAFLTIRCAECEYGCQP